MKLHLRPLNLVLRHRLLGAGITVTLICAGCSPNEYRSLDGKLFWIRCPQGSKLPECKTGPGTLLNWDAATKSCAQLKFGKKTWRLPKLGELLQLRQCSSGEVQDYLMPLARCRQRLAAAERNSCALAAKRCSDEHGYAVLNRELFPATEPAPFWTSSTSAQRRSQAWAVTFNQGYAQTTSKLNKLYVRCVSSTPDD